MKKLLLIAVAVLMYLPLLAQTPQSFSYQAVVRNANNELIVNQRVSVRISILAAGENGDPVYVENHYAQTNNNGLFSISVGAGTPEVGNFNRIDWGSAIHYLKTEIDTRGGSSFNITTVQQLLSVPYSLFAQKADSVNHLPAEQDPLFSSWNKDYYDLTNRPEIPQIPDSISAFVNDAGYLTEYSESDPNVPDWAKQPQKPSYSYNEIDSVPVLSTVALTGNYSDLSNRPEIPQVPDSVSAFVNDAGYLTEYSESDPNVPDWAKQPQKPSYSYSEIESIPVLSTVALTGNYSDLSNRPEIPQVPDSVSAFVNDAGYLTEYSEIQTLSDVVANGNSANGYQLKNVANPTDSQDVVTLSYLDSELTNLASQVAQKQDILVNGVSIKTINGESILGSGNIEIEAAGETIDPNTTYLYLQIPANKYVDWRDFMRNNGLVPVNGATMSFDYGDGLSYDDLIAAYNASEDNLKHTYTEAGEYVVKITNVKEWQNLIFRNPANNFMLKKVVFGIDVSFVRSLAFDGCTNLTEIVMQQTEPMLSTNSGAASNPLYKAFNGCTGLKSIVVPTKSLFRYVEVFGHYAITTMGDMAKLITPNQPPYTTLLTDIEVTVGSNGDFSSINDAMRYLSQFYPTYKYGGVHAYIKILQGTTITEQVLVVGADWSWMTIIAEGYNPSSLNYDNVCEGIANGTIQFDTTSGYVSVPVNASSWTEITHDTRGDVVLFRAEDGGKLPTIGCVFKLVGDNSIGVAGVVCNRGSECVVKTLCGFIGFKDGVISNNESSITIREGITMNCSRWGCHSRHNGEVSARSVIATGCGTANTNESAALCSDRVADLDGREAWVSAGNCQLRCNNASRMNCNGTHIIGAGTTEITSTFGSIGNYAGMFVDGTIKLTHANGGTMVVSNYTTDGTYTYNAVSNKGIIYR